MKTLDRYLRGITLWFLCFAWGLPALAQQGTIQGVVMDPTGGVVPDTQIRLTNTDTEVSASTRTNAQGFYSVSFLNPGHYSVRAEHSGFATLTHGGIKLDVGQTARVDFKLQLGQVAQTVEVSAASTLIDSQTTVVGQVVNNKEVVELPLNGRNYLELAQLTAGVSPSRGSRQAGNGAFSALGQNGAQAYVALDGVDNSSRVSGGIMGNEAQMVTPSIDSIAEFKVVTNNNSAEYGFRMGGNVIVSTKPGTNNLHGSLYEFLRNAKLDGTNFFAVGQPKPPYKRNQFGGTVGGPIIRNRTFFFGSYEGTRIRLGQARTSTVPIMAYRNGEFAGGRPIFDWMSTRPNPAKAGTYIRDPFPGNRIPPERFDPVAAKIISLYPEPNLPGKVNNYFFSPSQSRDSDEVDARLDHNLTDAHRAFFRYSRRTFSHVNPGPLPTPADGGSWNTEDLTAHSGVASLSSTFSPSRMNEFRLGVSRAESLRDVPYDKSLFQDYGITGLPDFGSFDQRGLPRFQPTGYQRVGSSTFWPNNNNLSLFDLNDTVMLIRGRHMIKTGFSFHRERLFRRAARFSRGFYAFNRSFTQNPLSRGNTGDGLADFLLGTASTATIGNANGEDPVAHNYSAFVQDDWRVTSRLTLNIGLRWDVFGPPSFRQLDKLPVSNYVFTPGSQEYTIVRAKDEGDCGCDHDLNNFGPRIGFAYQATAKTVIRSGFGIVYGQPDAISFFGDARFQNLPPDFVEITPPTDRLFEPSAIVSQGFPSVVFPATSVPENVFVNTADRFMPSQYVQQWFIDIQRELPFNSVLTLSYLGNSSHHLVQVRDVNQPLTPGPGSVKSRSQHPYFGPILYRDPGGNGSYNGMTVKLEKRYSRGLSMLVNYTWSHDINNVNEALASLNGQELQDNYDLKRNRGNSVFDTRHTFVSSVIYDLPVGRGRTFLNVGGPLDWVLGGWQVSGILALRTGAYFTPRVHTDISNTGTVNPTGGTSIRNHPDRLLDGNLPSSQRSIDQWFDVSAFAIPEQYTYGNAGRNILVGPGLRNLDLKVGKNFVFGAEHSKRVEFRGEFFNFSNTPHFGLPADQIDVAGVGAIRSAGSPREIQFGLKFLF